MKREFQADTLVIGAGLIGSSVAMHLGMQGEQDVLVVDFDLEGTLSSSELNAGGVRATWLQPVNIAISKLSIDYFSKHAADVGYRPCGYLWLHTPEKFPLAVQAREKQGGAGWPIDAWDLAELRRRVPFIDKTDGIGGVIFAHRDGLINPNLLKNHYRAEARAHGVHFEDRIWLKSAELRPDGFHFKADRYSHLPSAEGKLEIVSGRASPHPKFEVTIHAKRVVNCAGAWAPEIARMLGYASPSKPVRRQVCIFDTRDVDLTPYGMIVDTSGVYFHPEGPNGLAGFANPEEPPGINFEYDGESFFMQSIWPALYERSTAFEKLKHVTGWAGLYEVSPDESAIIGVVSQGDVGKSGCLYEAHSFSGHGAMQSYAAGLALSELLVRKRFETLDLSELSGDRFAKGRLISETLVI